MQRCHDWLSIVHQEIEGDERRAVQEPGEIIFEL
jgi:hypothetical protein